MPSRNIAFAAALAALCVAGADHAFGAPSADDIMKQDFVASKVADSTQDATFHLINAQGQERIRETSGQTKLLPGTTDNRRIVVFNAPADVRGTKTLLIEHSGGDDDIWIYLPAMKKVRRLVANNKKDSFVGTDFSYGDVIGYPVEDWNHTLLREETLNGADCWVIQSIPKSARIADVSGYSKRITWIDKRSYIAVKSEIYDLQGAFLKRLTQTDVREVDAKNHKWQAMRLTAENVQTGHRTVIELKNFKANAGVSDAEFTPGHLEN
jgi:outer membrane lipoprotein-sorting protein